MIPFILASGIILISLFALSSSMLNYANPFLLTGLAIIKFLGCIITAILLWYEIDKSNPFIQQICSAGGKTNCSAVLESRGAKIFNWISWSEVGFFYFAGSFLFLMIGGIDQPVVSLLGWINVATLPYCFYSIYYQWRVVKEWCPLCIAVQILLLFEFGVLFFLFWHDINSIGQTLTTHAISLLFASFIIPVLFWSYSKLYFIQAKSGKIYKRELDRLKYNYQFFDTLLSKQKILKPLRRIGNYCRKSCWNYSYC